MIEFDPLDKEILERALDGVCAALSDNKLDPDESLKAALLRELVEIASSHEVSDPEALRDLVLAKLQFA